MQRQGPAAPSGRRCIDCRETAGRPVALPRPQVVLVPTSQGDVPVAVVLAGARVVKAQPDMAACLALAALQLQQLQQLQGQQGPAAAVGAAMQEEAQRLAAEASQSFQRGLEDGSIALPLLDWF